MTTKAEVAIIVKVINKASKQLNAISSSANKMSVGLNKAGNSMKAFGAKTKAGTNLTKNLTLPILAIGGAMVKTFADFDATMTNIEARTGATADQMENIRKVAIRMGRDTAFSANQAGDAMLELMSSGSSVEEAISTLPNVLDLAAAGQLELGRSADIVTDILAQFREGIENSEKVVNALAAGAQSSSADIESLAQGFGNVGPIAKNFGISIEETAATLAVFAENGIKGAQAGTQLKSMLTAMSNQTTRTQGAWERLGTSMFDAADNVKNIDTIIDELNSALSGLTEQERIATIQDLAGSFGQMGLSALLASDGIDTMQAKMLTSQTASQVAKKQMESFNGAVNQLSGSLQTMAIVVIGPFVKNTLQPMIEGVTKALNVFTDWAAKNERLATVIVSVVAAIALIGPALFIIGAASSVFGTILTGFSAVSTGATFLMGILGPLAGLLTAVVVPALGIASTAFTGFWLAVTGPAGIAAIALTGFILAVAKFNPAIGGMIEQLGIILRQVIGQVGKLMGQILEIITKTLSRAAEQFFQLGAIFVISIAKGIFSAVKFAIQAISDVGNSIIGTVQGLFGISSPSTVMMAVGQNLGTSLVGGFANSVSQGMSQVAPQVNKLFGGFSFLGNRPSASGGKGLFSGFSFTGGGRDIIGDIKKALSSPDLQQSDRQGIFDALGGNRVAGGKGSLVDRIFNAVQSGQITAGQSQQFRGLLGSRLGGGAPARIPSFTGRASSFQPSPAGAGGRGNITINIETLNVRQGTPKEQAQEMLKEVGKLLAKRGVKGF